MTEINGAAQTFYGHQDNVNVPFQETNAPPGQVKVLIDFRNPIITGKFVYHCHILEHEDGGMMAVAEAVAAPVALAGRIKQAVDRVLKPDAAQQAALAEQTLNAIQSGSYCRTEPALPEVKIVRAPAPAEQPVTTGAIKKVRIEPTKDARPQKRAAS